MKILTLISATTLAFASSGAMAKFEAHEWGTFASLVGSNGTTQNGMYHEDEKLPEFVHGFGATQDPSGALFTRLEFPPDRQCRSKGCFSIDFLDHNVITQKMETPVIYFYSDQPRKVDVNVRFPKGVITETYPAPIATSPTRADIKVAANGESTFRLDILGEKSGNIPEVSEENIYSHARRVDSNLVRSGNEQEKFLFYRGIGQFQPKLEITSVGGALSLRAPRTVDRPQAIFLAHVNAQGDGQLSRADLYYGQANISAESIAALKDHGRKLQRTGVLRGHDAREALIGSLVAAGLKEDEAIAMVNTWENGYLKAPGLRVLYILPRAEVDEALPLAITPAPEKLERVFVGRIEVLLDTEEQAILERIRTEGQDFQVSSLGRFAEPILRRVKELADPSLKALLSKLVTQAAYSTEIEQ